MTDETIVDNLLPLMTRHSLCICALVAPPPTLLQPFAIGGIWHRPHQGPKGRPLHPKPGEPLPTCAGCAPFPFGPFGRVVHLLAPRDSDPLSRPVMVKNDYILLYLAGGLTQVSS